MLQQLFYESMECVSGLLYLISLFLFLIGLISLATKSSRKK